MHKEHSEEVKRTLGNCLNHKNWFHTYSFIHTPFAYKILSSNSLYFSSNKKDKFLTDLWVSICQEIYQMHMSLPYIYLIPTDAITLIDETK
jgi:hypothetical protein